MNKKLRIALTAAGCIVLALAAFTVSLYGRYMTPPARIVFLSPSTQAGNIYADGVTTERDNMNAIADLIGQHLPDDFTVLRNDPNLTVKEAVDASNAAGSGIHVALHSNAAGTDAVVRGCEVYIRMRDYPFAPSRRVRLFCRLCRHTHRRPWNQVFLHAVRGHEDKSALCPRRAGLP